MIGVLSLMLLAGAPQVTPCDTLTSLSTREVVVASATLVPEGVFTPPGRGGAGGARGAAPDAQGGAARGGRQTAAPAVPPAPIPEHCRVTMVLKPSADSTINAELWLPARNWNGRFLAVGNGGFGGAIQGYGDMQAALRAGYATAGNDTGHSAADGPGGMFGLGHPEKIVDFAYRAMHEMTVTSKRMIDRYYGRAPQFSYSKGCSTGGRQGMMAAQRYPDDFDGIIAGALANRHIQMHTAGVYRSIEVTRRPELAISQQKARFVSDWVMNRCDTLKEGFLNNPRACTVDFTQLACQGNTAAENCLTNGELESVQAFYGGVKNSKGELIFSGQALGNPVTPRQPLQGNATPGGGFDTVRIWGFQNADYDWRTFDLDRDMPLINARVGFVDAVDPDLSRFKARGGKLLLYAGWGDTGITPENTVLYYESVLGRMGRNQDDWIRLFLVPGMGHCSGGPGPHTFDTLGTLDQWREKGLAPAQIMGSNPQSGLTRPLCPYPQFADYKGTGDLKDAANWACKAP